MEVGEGKGERGERRGAVFFSFFFFGKAKQGATATRRQRTGESKAGGGGHELHQPRSKQSGVAMGEEKEEEAR